MPSAARSRVAFFARFLFFFFGSAHAASAARLRRSRSSAAWRAASRRSTAVSCFEREALRHALDLELRFSRCLGGQALLVLLGVGFGVGLRRRAGLRVGLVGLRLGGGLVLLLALGAAVAALGLALRRTGDVEVVPAQVVHRAQVGCRCGRRRLRGRGRGRGRRPGLGVGGLRQRNGHEPCRREARRRRELVPRCHAATTAVGSSIVCSSAAILTSTSRRK